MNVGDLVMKLAEFDDDDDVMIGLPDGDIRPIGDVAMDGEVGAVIVESGR